MQRFQVNHLGREWASLIEIMAMIAVVGLAITAMFSTVIGGIYFAKDSENRIKAISLAREWLEWVTNMRNTNWLRFSSDQINCWRVRDYVSNCIGNSTFVTTPTTNGIWTIWSTVPYVLMNQNGAWYLSGAIATTGSGLWIDNNWFYTATGTTTWWATCSLTRTTNCRSPFTRQIRVTIPSGNTGSISVTAVVDWYEKKAQNVTLTTTLTNWKSKF